MPLVINISSDENNDTNEIHSEENEEEYNQRAEEAYNCADDLINEANNIGSNNDVLS